MDVLKNLVNNEAVVIVAVGAAAGALLSDQMLDGSKMKGAMIGGGLGAAYVLYDISKNGF